MNLKTKKVLKALIIFPLVLCLLCSCTQAGKKRQLIKRITENLRSSYVSEITYSVRSGENILEGTARLTKDMTVTRLDILSPEPYSGLSVEYNISGAPSSVAVHFAGIDTTLPREALSNINIISSLAADDFLYLLSMVGGESITEYEMSENMRGYCASLTFGELSTQFCFSEDGNTPYSLSLSSDKISADIVFTKFKLDLQ